MRPLRGDPARCLLGPLLVGSALLSACAPTAGPAEASTAPSAASSAAGVSVLVDAALPRLPLARFLPGATGWPDHLAEGQAVGDATADPVPEVDHGIALGGVGSDLFPADGPDELLDGHRPGSERAGEAQEAEPAHVPGAAVRPADLAGTRPGRCPAEHPAGHPGDHHRRKPGGRAAERRHARRAALRLDREHRAAHQPVWTGHRGAGAHAERGVLAGGGVLPCRCCTCRPRAPSWAAWCPRA